jgi:hypothetical protein
MDARSSIVWARAATGLRASATGLCDNRRLSIARLVSVPGQGTLLTRLVVGGHATFRLTSGGAPFVELSSENPIELGQVAMTDAKGFVRFSDAPPGALRLVASADGFVTAGMRISDDSRDGIVLGLSRGHRVVVGVELSAEAGPYLVRVANEAGASMERFLDSASDRSIEPPGRMSLGPLAPGAYVIELHGAREHRQERVRIVDRDVYAIFR